LRPTECPPRVSLRCLASPSAPTRHRQFFLLYSFVDPRASHSFPTRRSSDLILVFTSEPFKEGTEVSGPMIPTLYFSSDAKDTDFTGKVLVVLPDWRAYNLDEAI